MQKNHKIIAVVLSVSLFLIAASPLTQSLDPQPPDEVVKLVFIHHSTGENWLTDGYGNLGQELGRSSYFVSDTNYGWGPDGIGDRTDIPDWLEWFRSPQTPAYMQALFNENELHSSYTRSLSDPGGENQIIMFKSCFPNSELAGSPNDPPGTYADLSVAGAKYVYNDLLKYFSSRPDKLFVIITAPPLTSSSHANNARAFNQWLVNDWLRENSYTLPNVAVFDFYNVLTSPDAHHRYQNGQIEHVVGAKNTLYYPSGDDHPSEKGSRKAADEFIPLLNIFYNNWKANTQLDTPVESAAPITAEEQPLVEPQLPSAPVTSVGVIDDFETDNPPGTSGWAPFWDETTSTSMHCAAESGTMANGSRSLILDFDVAPNSWVTCALFYETAQNWSSGEGLTFLIHYLQAGLIFDVDVYVGDGDARETYLFTVETPPDSIDGWVPISLDWSDFHRADWEANAGEPLTKPDQISGLAFGMNTYPDTPNTGTIWVDDLALLGQNPAPETASAGQQVDADEPSRGLRLPCGAAFALPVLMINLGIWNRKKVNWK